MKILSMLVLLAAAISCTTETRILDSQEYNVEETTTQACCEAVETNVCYFGPTAYNRAELMQLASDSSHWVQTPLVFAPGRGVRLDCQRKNSTYRLTWN